MPYALEALRLSGDRPLTDREVKDRVFDLFGLDLPVNVVSSLIGRGAKQSLVKRAPRTRELTLSEGAAAKLPDIASQQLACRREQTALVRGLISFAQTRFEIEWDETTAETALVDYIESHAVSLLSFSVRGRNPADYEGADQGSGYIVAAYIALVAEGNPSAFGYLDQMVKGSMLASALYLEVPNDVQRRFRRTILYLDTPICLRALGHEGSDAQEATQQVLRLAMSQGASLACFSHSVKEMRGILEGTKVALRRTVGAESAMRGVATHFRSSDYNENDVNLAVERLERDLDKVRIRVVDTPEHTTHFGVDENELEHVLQEKINYKYEHTLLPDLNSLTAIHRLRGGESGPHLETCKAVLITDNSALVRASRSFFNSGRHEWPLAMLDHTLAALVWVKEPTQAPDLPRQRIIADCYAALAPSPNLWLKVADEIDRLDQRGSISAEDVALLRYSNEAQQSLMDMTLGDPRRVSPKAISTALARARESAAAPAVDEKRQAESRAEKAEEAEAASRFLAHEKASEAQALRTRLDSLEARDTRRVSAIRKSAERRAGALGLFVKALVVVVLVGATIAGIATFFPVVNEFILRPLRLPILIAGAVAFTISILILAKGKSILEYVGIQQAALQARFEKSALQRAGLVEAEQPQDEQHDGA
ncbi:hypothetical protein [Nocardioides mangrovicus]|uniref:hypothetical protein n=1 Tax=Nocardioides mangrovicus TaxID=2478913 RepID=UPI0011C3E3AA|nr:hypothetical protein [Nocardioides mangrovicus]